MTKLLPILCLTFAVLLFTATEGLALPACPEDRDERYHKFYGTYTFADGDKYVGEWRDDKNHGQGTYYYLADDKFKGDKYVGEFRDGYLHGQCTDQPDLGGPAVMREFGRFDRPVAVIGA